MHFPLFVMFIMAIGFAQGLDDDEEQSWQQWRNDNPDMEIGRDDEDVRRTIFHDTYSFVKKYQGGNNSNYQVALNKLAAFSADELKQSRLGFKAELSLRDPTKSVSFDSSPDLSSIPSSLDWRTKGAVTPVKDQGQCGSCWSFSSTGALESRTFIKTKSLVSLSEQNLVDCSKSLGNAGCNGGVMDLAFQYAKISGGLDTESSYPYTAVDTGRCRFNKATAKSPVISYHDIPAGNELALMQAVSSGPVSIAIEVVQSFYYYQSGVYSDSTCGNNLNHAMLVVGYGTDPVGGDYWLVKNSWGTWWGENGYIRIARGSNMCGITMMASYPVV